MNPPAIKHLAAAALLALSAAVGAAAEGTGLLPGDLRAFKTGGRNAADARVTPVDVAGQPFQQALRVETLKRPPYPWNITLYVPTTGAIRKGDVLLATVTARRIHSRQETGEALVELIAEESAGEHRKLLELATSVGSEWTAIHAPFVADRDYAAGAVQVSMRFGYQPQTIEVAAVGLANYGTRVALRDLPATRARYAGWEADAAWRKAAAERIEAIRKGDLKVEVVDAAGRPVPGARVSVRMLRHEFAFGSAIQARRIARPEGADDERYRQTVAKHFNKVVFENDLKWPRWQTNQPGWEAHRTNVLLALDWFRERNIAVRGHVMVWPSWENTPGWLRPLAAQPDRLRAAIDGHIAGQTAALRGRLDEWDVINESYAHNDIVKVLGRGEMARWFRLAREGDPSVKLFYNDYIMFAGSGAGSPSQYFFDTVKFLKEQGAPIDGIGEQGHFGGSPPSPERVLATFDRFATLGVPIQISEFDIDTGDEELKVHYTRDFLTACFSHPAVNGVMMWGFWEGAHWRPRAALWNKDWSIRPHGQVWLDLVMNEWRTNAEGVTDARGCYGTRAFCGDYEVTLSDGGSPSARRVTVPRTGAVLRLVRGGP